MKGIAERSAIAVSNDRDKVETLWDGDWVGGQFKTLLMTHIHSKKMIRDSVINDTAFLAESNIMDYSLLVGVDDERKELVVGIVDFIGHYNWYKKLENKGKTTLRGKKEATVMPPEHYRDRFRAAVENYFLAVPGKQSESLSNFVQYPF